MEGSCSHEWGLAEIGGMKKNETKRVPVDRAQASQLQNQGRGPIRNADEESVVHDSRRRPMAVMVDWKMGRGAQCP